MEPQEEPSESNFYFKRSLSSNDIAALKRIIEKEVQNSKERPAGSTEDLSKTKCMSVVAVAMYDLREDTRRSHSTRPKKLQSQIPRPKKLTRPQSLKLRCEDRSRPVHHMTQGEREQKVLEEIQKIKNKANPIPQSVLEGTNLSEVSSKPITVTEPFESTEINIKTTQQLDDKAQSFKGRPVSKHILQNLKVPTKIPARITKSCSPTFHSQKSITPVPKQVTPASHTKISAQRHGPVKPVPFSFEKRNEHLRKLKDEKIQRQIEEEHKQATKFKASPVPERVKKIMQSVSLKSGTTKENKENNPVKFKAKSPMVLYKEPFKPVLQPSQVKPITVPDTPTLLRRRKN